MAFAGSQWSVLILAAPAVSHEALGAYVYVTTFTAPLLMLSNLSLRTVLVSSPDGTGMKYGSAVNLRAVTTACFVLLSMAWGCVKFPSGNYLALAAVVILTRGIDALAEVRLSVPQTTGRMDRVGKYWLMNSTLTVVAFAVGVWWFESLVLGGALSCLASLSALTYLWSRSQPEVKVPQSSAQRSHHMKLLLRSGTPLAATMFLVSLNANIPRLQLEATVGLGAVAVFAAVSYFGLAAQIVLTGVGEALLRPMSEAGASNPTAFLRYLAFLAGMGIASALALLGIVMLIGTWLITLVYGEGYAQYASALIPAALSLAPILVFSAFGFGLTALRKYGAQTPILLVTLGTTAAAGGWLIPAHGISGGLAAQGVGAGAGCAIAMVVTLRALKERSTAR